MQLSPTNVSPLAPMRSVAWLAIVSAATPASSQGYLGEDPSLLAKYRCGVLGDTSRCVATAPRPSLRIEERLVLGPRAKYLIYLGVDHDSAVARARLDGEVIER
jgi:hypothetical protein